MGSNYTGLTVTWFDESDGYSTTTDITSDTVSIPLFTDTGSGEVNECEIVISAKGGKYLTTGSIFDKYDRLRIQITDITGNTYDRYFEVQDIIPSQSKTEGTLVTLICLGIEYHTQVIHYSRRDWFENAFDVALKIGTLYEANRGIRQPILAQHDTAYTTGNSYGNDLPTFTNNHYEFGASEDSCYNRLLDITDLLGGAATSGGVGDFYDLTFDTTGVNGINMALFVSGKRTFDGNDPANDSSAVVIENTTNINVSEQEGGISNPTATKVAVWGSPTHGSLPLGTAKYRAQELEFIFRPQWTTGLLYVVGSKVLDVATGKHYECAIEHTSGTFATDLTASKWTIIDMSSEFGDDIQYSPWTDDKALLWANSGGDPDGVSAIPAWATSTSYVIGDIVSNGGNQYMVDVDHTSDGSSISTDITAGKLIIVDNALIGNGASFFDSNIVIRDDGVMFRTWVHEAGGDSDYDNINDLALSTNYLHDNNHWPHGHRVLNINDTNLSGKDNRGKSFIDAVVQYTNARKQGDSSQWEVIYEQPTSKLNKMQVYEIKTSKIWEWDNGTSKWLDKTNPTETVHGDSVTTRNDDCAHQWKSIYNIAGSDSRVTTQSTTPFNEDANDFSTNIRSAVEVCYSFSSIFNDFISSTADSKKGAWLNFSFPYPVTKFNSISEGVGDIFGGGTNEDAAGNTQPSILDTQNMSFTPTGLTGFNQTDSEALGPLTSISFNSKLKITGAGGQVLGGAATARCVLVDGKDNIVVQDFEHRFTDGKSWQSINLPFSGFSNYRGRVPKNWVLRWASTIIGIDLPIQELDIQDVFEFHNIKHILFQIQDFYDEEGRYDPQNDLLEVTNTGAFTASGGTIRFAIDAFHFKKRLLAITGQPSVQNIEPKFLQRPNIISYTQLLNEAKSELEIQQFREKIFNFQTSGKSIFDIPFGETFFLKNTDLIGDNSRNETALGDGDGEAGTIRLVAKRIEYHLTKPTSGPGGITRSIKGVRRFTI